MAFPASIGGFGSPNGGGQSPAFASPVMPYPNLRTPYGGNGRNPNALLSGFGVGGLMDGQGSSPPSGTSAGSFATMEGMPSYGIESEDKKEDKAEYEEFFQALAILGDYIQGTKLLDADEWHERARKQQPESLFESLYVVVKNCNTFFDSFRHSLQKNFGAGEDDDSVEPCDSKGNFRMLAHPDEFKNPSSFLKVYGDPRCKEKGPALPKKGVHGNWECPNCRNINFPRRFHCNQKGCNAKRDKEGDDIVSEYARQVYQEKRRQYEARCGGTRRAGRGGGGGGGNVGPGGPQGGWNDGSHSSPFQKSRNSSNSNLYPNAGDMSATSGMRNNFGVIPIREFVPFAKSQQTHLQPTTQPQQQPTNFLSDLGIGTGQPWLSSSEVPLDDAIPPLNVLSADNPAKESPKVTEKVEEAGKETTTTTTPGEETTVTITSTNGEDKVDGLYDGNSHYRRILGIDLSNVITNSAPL